MNPRRVLLTLLAVIVTSVTAGPPAEGQGRNTGALEYVRGLEALEVGDYVGAAGSFTRAIQGDSDKADYYLTRGVAFTLAEQFPAAEADLERAQTDLSITVSDDPLACVAHGAGSLLDQLALLRRVAIRA